MYAKYSVAACAIALAIGLLLTGHGELLHSRWLVFGVALTALLLLPNALWQIGHGFPMLEVLHNDQLNRHAFATAWPTNRRTVGSTRFTCSRRRSSTRIRSYRSFGYGDLVWLWQGPTAF